MRTSKTLRQIRVALSLARIVAINVVALVIAAMAAVHVYHRQRAPRPGPLMRGILAAHPATGPSGAAPTIEIDTESEPAGAATGGAERAPASPGVNDAIRR